MSIKKLVDSPIVYSTTMNIDDAVKMACQQSSLTEALAWIAIWENERAIKQARSSTSWDTCFQTCFERVMEAYGKEPKPQNELEEFIIEVTEVKHVKVTANCFLAALDKVWDAEKDSNNIIPNPYARAGQLTKKTAGLSVLDSRYDKE